MSDGPLKLGNQDFWFDPYRTEDEVIHELIADDFEGLVLDGPRLVDVTRMTSLPIQGVRAQKTRDALALPPFSASALVVGVRLDRNRATVSTVTDRPVERPANRADVDPGDRRTYEGFRLNGRTRCAVDWEPSELAVWVLQRDQLSNRVLTRLVKQAEPEYVDPVVGAFVDEHKKTPYPQPIWPKPAPPPSKPRAEQALPHYRALEGSPPVPDAPGIALSTERVIEVDDGFGGCILRGSFRLSVLPGEVVRERKETDEEYLTQLALKEDPPAPAEPPMSDAEKKGLGYLKDSEVEWPPEPSPPAEKPVVPDPVDEAEWRFFDQDDLPEPRPQGPWETGHVWQEVGDDEATAVIPITLVIVSAKLTHPFVLDLKVPTYDPVPAEGGEATGWFTIDLLGFKDSYAMRGQTSWIYAFSGRHAAGPCAVAILKIGAR